jgi:hypothetical protein
VWDLQENRDDCAAAHTGEGKRDAGPVQPDGRYLAVGTASAGRRLWHVDDWSLAWQAETGHNGYDVAVSFSPDGSILASSGSDSKIFLYDVASGELLGEAFGPNRNSWLYAEFLADRTEIVGYFDDGSMSRWMWIPPPRSAPRARSRGANDSVRVGACHARPPYLQSVPSNSGARSARACRGLLGPTPA